MATAYTLREDVRVYFHNDDEIRFRKGVWNYIEAIVNLRGQPDKVRTFFQSVVVELVKEPQVPVDIDVLAERASLSAEEMKGFGELFDSVKRQGYLYAGDEGVVRRALTGILGGSFSVLAEFAGRCAPIVYLSDDPGSRELARTTAKQMGLPLQILDADVLEQLAAVDLTSKTDAIEHIKTLGKFQPFFADFACVAGTFLTPNISLLRNLNRILVKQEKPFVFGLVDGPFISVASCVALQSGCFECYEHRLLARLEDTLVYHKFVSSTREQVRHQAKPSPLAPITNILTSAVLMEGLLYSSLSLLKLTGRVINVYMPMFEIQVQDLLRVPYCPACGHIAQAQMNEMHISSRAIMDRMLERVELRHKAK